MPDLVSRVFQRVGRGGGGRHVAVSSAQLQEMARAEEFILISRNLEQWRAGARAEAVDPGSTTFLPLFATNLPLIFYHYSATILPLKK